jgi:cyanophycinase
MIIVFDPKKIKHNNQKILNEGTPMTLTNMIVHVLSNGDRYNIATGEINILPIEAPFV